MSFWCISAEGIPKRTIRIGIYRWNTHLQKYTAQKFHRGRMRKLSTRQVFFQLKNHWSCSVRRNLDCLKTRKKINTHKFRCLNTLFSVFPSLQLFFNPRRFQLTSSFLSKPMSLLLEDFFPCFRYRNHREFSNSLFSETKGFIHLNKVSIQSR